MIPTPKIRVFGKLQIWDQNGNPVHLPTKKTELLLAYLVIASRPKSRSDLAESVWPGSEYEKARVSLRTAIAALRKTLGKDAIIGNEQTLELAQHAIECDLVQARRLVRRIAITPPGPNRKPRQEELADLIANPLLEDIEDDIVNKERQYWLESRQSLLLALAESYLEGSQPEKALAAAQSALKIDPLHEPAILVTMRTLALLDRTEEAIKLSQETAKKYKSEHNTTLPRKIIELAAEIKTGKLLPTFKEQALFAESTERRLLAAFIQAGLKKNPDQILRLVCDESFHPMAVHHLKEYLAILEQCLQSTDGNSESRLLTARTASRTASLLNDNLKTLGYAQMVLDHTDPDNPMHVAMLSFVAYVYIEARNWNKAKTYFDQALDLAKKNGFEYDITSTTMNLASIRVSLLQWEGTEEDILWSTDRARIENLSPFRTATAILYAANYYLAAENYEMVLAYADESLAVTGNDAAFYNTATASALRALALAKLGKYRPALEAVSQALEITYAIGTDRGIQIALDHTATVLACAGKPIQAIWIADSVFDSRNEIDFPRTPLEQRIIVDNVFSPNPQTIESAQATNRLRHQPLPTLVEFAIDEVKRTLSDLH